MLSNNELNRLITNDVLSINKNKNCRINYISIKVVNDFCLTYLKEFRLWFDSYPQFINDFYTAFGTIQYNWRVDNIDYFVLAKSTIPYTFEILNKLRCEYQEDIIFKEKTINELKDLSINEEVYIPKIYFSSKANKLIKDGWIILDDLDYGNYILLKIENEKDHQIMYMTPDEEFHSLAVSFPEYVELLYRSKGIYGWQAYICDEYPSIHLEDDYDNFIENLNSLFPNGDTRPFMKHHRLANENGKKKSYLDKLKEFNYQNKLIESFGILFLSKNIIPNKNQCFLDDNQEKLKFAISSQAILRQADCHLKFKIPDALRYFYIAMDSFRFGWNHKTREDISANFNIVGISDLLDGRVRAGKQRKGTFQYPFINCYQYYGLDMDSSWEKEGKEWGYEKIYPFYLDRVYTMDVGWASEEGQIVLYLIPPEAVGKPEKMTCSFEVFIDELCNTRGLTLWHYFLGTDQSKFDDITRHEFKYRLKLSFPNSNTSKYDR